MQMSGQSGCAWVHLAGLSWLSCGSATLIPERLPFLAIEMSLTLNKCLKNPNSAGKESLTFPMSRQSSEEEAEARPVWDGLQWNGVGVSKCVRTDQEPFVFVRVYVCSCSRVIRYLNKKIKTTCQSTKIDDMVKSLFIHNTNLSTLSNQNTLLLQSITRPQNTETLCNQAYQLANRCLSPTCLHAFQSHN